MRTGKHVRDTRRTHPRRLTATQIFLTSMWLLTFLSSAGIRPLTPVLYDPILDSVHPAMPLATFGCEAPDQSGPPHFVTAAAGLPPGTWQSGSAVRATHRDIPVTPAAPAHPSPREPLQLDVVSSLAPAGPWRQLRTRLTRQGRRPEGDTSRPAPTARSPHTRRYERSRPVQPRRRTWDRRSGSPADRTMVPMRDMARQNQHPVLTRCWYVGYAGNSLQKCFFWEYF